MCASFSNLMWEYVPREIEATWESFPRQWFFFFCCGKSFHVTEVSGENTPAPVGSESLIASLRRILRPLVRLAIARSLPFPFVANILRGLFIDVAVKEFPVSGRPQSDSRITLLTGVHRKDVRRLRHQPRDVSAPPRAASLGSQLIGRWTALPEYLDENGAPRPLPRLASANEPHTFESLVRSINTDIRPRVVLDEWLRLGIARIDEQDRVCLEVQAFIPREGSEEMTYFFGRNLHDHLAAAVHNMLGETPPLFERSVNYNNLGPAAVAELAELAQRRGMEVLQELNAKALRLQRQDAGQPSASRRFNFGLYLFSEDQAVPPTEDEDPEDGQS